MIPKKIELKLKNKCGEDKSAFDALLELLEYEDSGNGRQNIHLKQVVEKYEKEVNKNED